LIVVQPPVVLHEGGEDNSRGANILLVESTTGARHIKHFAAALNVLVKLQEMSFHKLMLYVDVAQHPHDEADILRVRKKIGRVDGVEVLNRRDPHQDVLRTISVVWSFADNGGLHAELAEEIYLTDSVVEAMSAGAIPVLADQGWRQEVVGDNPAHLCATLEAFALTTLGFLELKGGAEAAARREAVKLAGVYGEKAFDAHLSGVFKEHELSFLWPQLTAHIGHQQLQLPFTGPNAAVILETRSSIIFPLVVKLNLNMLQANGTKWRLFVFHGTDNEHFVRASLADVQGVVFTNMNRSSIGEDDNNNLMKSASFWGPLAAQGVEKVLMFQVDGLIVRPGVEAFLRFDFIGAPWHHTNSVYRGVSRQPGQRFDPLNETQRVGNGGMSLRSTKAMLEASRRFGLASTVVEPEDVFHARHLPPLGYTVATLKEAVPFSLEVPIMEFGVSKGAYRDVMMLHQPWLYANPEMKRQLVAMIQGTLDWLPLIEPE